LKYSFIIPVLNEEKIILKLLNQIGSGELKKKYDYEIILSDGGSRDATVKLALPFADKIVCHTGKFKQNIAMGRNSGAEKAEGDILIFLNGDIQFCDFISFMEIMVNEFTPSKAVAFTCNVRIVPEQELFADKCFLGFYNIYFHTLNLIGVGMGRGECHAVRSELYRKLNGNNPTLAAGEDFELFTRIRRKGKVLYSTRTCIYESPRRYRKKGHWHILLSWLANSASVILFKKSVSTEWEQVR
jgi:glycosyltransferase involved in cell wall biosynthesis